MAVTNPPGFLQNAGAVHTAEILRNSNNSSLVGARAASSMVPRGGVHPALGGALAVTQQGAPTMGITVASGHVFVPGTEGSTQGAYSCVAHTSTNVSVTAAHGSLPRIDLVVARVYDSAYSGASNTWALEVIAGTAASSPAAPAAPNNSLIIAQIAVAAAATQITNANITDRRPYLGMGIMPIATASDLPSVTFEGMYAFARDTDRLYFHDGTNWRRNYERSPVICKVFQGTGQTITEGTDTVLTFDSEAIDTDDMHSTSVNTSRITVPVAGYYRVIGNLHWAFNTTMQYSDLMIRQNGTVVQRAGNLQYPRTDVTAGIQNNVSKFGGHINDVFQAASGDYFELATFHRTNSLASQTTNATSGVASRMTVQLERVI